MTKKIRVITSLLVCAALSACQGSTGSGSSGTAGSGTSPTVSPAASPSQGGTTGAPAATTMSSSTSTQTTMVLIPSGTHSLGVYLRNPLTGTLVDRGYVPTGSNPGAVAVSNAGFVYVANTTADNISAYGWQSAQNELITLGAPVMDGQGMSSLATTGNYLYAVNANNTVGVFAIESNGDLSPLPAINGPSSSVLTTLVAGNNNALYGLGKNHVVSYSGAGTGSLTATSTVALSGIVAATTDASGTLYVLTTNGITTFTNTNGAGLTVSGTSVLPSGFTPVGLALADGYLAVAGDTTQTSSGSAGMEVVYFSVSGGLVGAQTTEVTGTGTVAGITASPNGHYVFVTNPTRNDLFAYTAPTATTASVMSAALRTRTPPRTPLSAIVTVTLQPDTLYVVNQSTDAVATYPSAANGALGTPTTATTCNASCSSPTSPNAGPSAAAIAPTGQNLYATDWAEAGQGDVTTFAMQTANGPLGTPYSIAAGISPMGVAVDPSDRYLYVANSCYTNDGSADADGPPTQPDAPAGDDGGNCPGTIDGYNLTHGTPSPFASGFSMSNVPGAYPMLLATDPTGRFLYSSEFAGDMVDSFSINQDSGALTSSGSYNTSRGPWTIVIGPSGRTLYVTDNGSDTVSLFTINSSTGTLTTFAPGGSPQGNITAPPPANAPSTSVSSKPLGLAIGPKGRRLYVATQDGNLDIFTRQDPLSTKSAWSWTPSYTVAGNFTNAYGLAISTNGKALYVVDNCTAPDYNNGNVQAFAIPAFSTMPPATPNTTITATDYAAIGEYSTAACSVQAIPAGGLN